MAAQPNSPLVTVEEYLNSSYHPEMEFVDGMLVERSVQTIAHSLLCMLLIEHFALFRRQLGFKALPEARTQIIELARYRVPDIVLCPEPLDEGRVVVTVPWAVIEIESPDDKAGMQRRRFRDYLAVGVRHMILLDPEDLIAHRFENGSLIQTAFTELQLPTGTLPFNTEEVFKQLVEERRRSG